MTPDQITGLLEAAGAFVVGVIVGFLVRGLILRRAPQAAVGNPTAWHAQPASDLPARTSSAARRRRDRLELAGRVVLGLIILALLAYQQVTVSQSNQRLHDLAACDAAQAQDIRDAITARSSSSRAVTQASDDNAAAQQAFLASVGPGQSRPKAAAAFGDYSRALDSYRQALAAQATAQDAHPLVARNCGGA